MRRSSIIILFAECHQDYQIEKDDFGSLCSTHGGDQKYSNVYEYYTPLEFEMD